MKAPLITVAGGIVDPKLYGRVDLVKYQTGVKVATNFVVGVEGGMEKRWGMYMLNKRKFQTSDKPAKLIPWSIAPDDSYMLEFGDLYIRFIRFGGYITVPDDHVPHADNDAANVDGFMEVVTEYAAEHVRQLKFTFANDVMYIFHPLYEPRQLKRLGLYDWDFIETSFDPHPAWSGGGSAVYTNATTGDDNYVVEPVPTEYKISATLADGTETKASPAIEVDADLGHRRTKVVISWSAVAGAVQYTIYKGANGIFGFIGYSTELEYTDRNFAPSYDVVPIGTSYSFPAGEYPGVGEFYKQRFAYGSSITQTQKMIVSRPGIFNSLTKSLPLQDDDAVEFTLAGRKTHTINHMIQLKKFLIFTTSSEWILQTLNNAPLSAATLDPVIETSYGSDPYLKPLAIADRVLFIQSTSGNLLDMGYEYTSDAFKADNLSRLAQHLFKNNRIVAYDSAPYPQNVIPCVTEDGTAAILSYAREHEIWGWGTHTTQGKLLDVACVTEIDHDGVYFQTERVINGVTTYFIERTEVNLNDKLDDMVYVDCAITYKVMGEFSELVILDENQIEFASTLTLVEGDEIQLEYGNITLRALVETAGTTYTATPLRVTIFPEEMDATGDILVCTETISDLDYLQGETIWALLDGKVQKELEIVGGSVTLPYSAARVHIGLPYNARLETLDLDAANAAGQYLRKTANDIILRLRKSRGVWVGAQGSERDLIEIYNRSTEDYYEANALLDGAYEVPSHVSWDMTCAIVIESRDPLPLNLLSITPDLEYGN